MPKIPWSQRLNRISLFFDREAKNLQDSRGKVLIPMILDHVLAECCSDEVIAALFRAIETDRTSFDYEKYEKE
jgi:hypothetical protein